LSGTATSKPGVCRASVFLEIRRKSG